ncbi:MAG TPA: helix-turn-helix domain-containing protein, partial [Thermoanaerobaculia bacterium]|nr:helix-turn-helix domain-containing protein [Thermoanaerobaculia bacterium]
MPAAYVMRFAANGTESVPIIDGVTTYGQFCSVSRTLDLLGDRWTLLIVRELLCGSSRFNDIRRGVPRISRTILSARLRQLVESGVVARGGSTYELTDEGRELAAVVRELGTWGQRWLPRTLPREQLDVDTLLWDMRRRVRIEELPATPVVARIAFTDIRGRASVRFLLLRRSEVSICSTNPGFPEELRITTPLRTLTAWWRGDLSLTNARAEGLLVEGRREWVRAFPRWFERYLFAEVAPARAAGLDPVHRLNARENAAGSE